MAQVTPPEIKAPQPGNDTVFAIDTSNRGGTWAYLEALKTGQYRVLGYGVFHSSNMTRTRREVKDLLKTLMPTYSAVESVAGYISRERLKRTRDPKNLDLTDLVDATIWAGFFLACMLLPHETVFIPANNKPRKPSWRYYLTKNQRAGDAEVLHSLQFYLEGGVPIKGKGEKQTQYLYNNHVRDAIGLGIIAHSLKTGGNKWVTALK